MQRLSDKELIERIKAKDDKVILFLRREYEPMIRYMILNYAFSDGETTVSASLSDAEDLLHDTFYILLDKILNKDFKLTAKLSTYFYAVAKNLLKLKLRKKLLETKKSAYNADFDYKQTETDKTDYLYDKKLKKNAFDYYFNRLSEVCKKILNLYWMNYSVTEIAEKLEYKKNYVMKRKYECTKRLTKLIKDNEDNLDF
ncbi:MAG: sigma-70 family RNA polymerase sigma factor [Chlorobi bacterium]|nr:sigma-70 family RNA polymerase sigma factor [Chlorobiota bacterium]